MSRWIECSTIAGLAHPLTQVVLTHVHRNETNAQTLKSAPTSTVERRDREGGAKAATARATVSGDNTPQAVATARKRGKARRVGDSKESDP